MICFTFAFGYDIILIICQISYWLLTCGNRWYNIFCYRNRWWMAPRPNIHCTHNNENNLDDRCYPWLVRSVSFVKKYLLIRILTKEFCQSLCILYNRLSWNTLKEQKKSLHFIWTRVTKRKHAYHFHNQMSADCTFFRCLLESRILQNKTKFKSDGIYWYS